MKIESINEKQKGVDKVYSVAIEDICDNEQNIYTTKKEAIKKAKELSKCVYTVDVFRMVWCDNCNQYEYENEHDFSADITEEIING